MADEGNGYPAPPVSAAVHLRGLVDAAASDLGEEKHVDAGIGSWKYILLLLYRVMTTETASTGSGTVIATGGKTAAASAADNCSWCSCRDSAFPGPCVKAVLIYPCGCFAGTGATVTGTGTAGAGTMTGTRAAGTAHALAAGRGGAPGALIGASSPCSRQLLHIVSQATSKAWQAIHPLY